MDELITRHAGHDAQPPQAENDLDILFGSQGDPFDVDPEEEEVREPLFPVLDEDIVPISDPLVIAQPHRFATKREAAALARQGITSLLTTHDEVQVYVTLKQWALIIESALEQLKSDAESVLVRRYGAHVVLGGADISMRNIGRGWIYPDDVRQYEREVRQMQELLKARKKEAERDGSARKMECGGSIVVTFRS